MAKYTEDAGKLLGLVGGKENISAVTHCMRRMRFVLVDEGKADVKAIEDLPSAKGTFTQAGQFQVIIGNDVADFYQEFTKISGIEGVSKEAAKAAAGGKPEPRAAHHGRARRDLRPHHPRAHLRRPGARLPQYHRRGQLLRCERCVRS